MEKLQAVRKEAEDAMQLSLRDVVGNLAIQAFKDPAEGPEFLHRAARQRVAFQMSQPLANGELAPYEIYICPPPDEPALLQGSILLHKDADGTNPDGFRVVLTPSCDLVQERRVEAILTAKCIDRESLASDRRRRLQKRLYHEELVNLPAYPGVLPDMVADLKRLALIGRDDIDAGQYTSVALLDSPFRETISWAYITVAGRPGLPDVDSD
ncbi:MAG: hypothetical protein OXC81_07580 [Betaproteobacteria bacterium]|nr:hypothetical protein [Betaproteobacteria bacterium]